MRRGKNVQLGGVATEIVGVNFPKVGNLNADFQMEDGVDDSQRGADGLKFYALIWNLRAPWRRRQYLPARVAEAGRQNSKVKRRPWIL